MIFPRGEVVHKNLSTAYTDLSALVSTLKSEGFSGTIEIEFPQQKGTLFFGSGEIVDAEVRGETEARRLEGQEAAQALLKLTGQKNGTVSIYRLPPERVAIVTKNLQNEIVFKGLSTDFTRFEGLLHKLREDKLSGFIEVSTKDNRPMGVLFLEDGEPVEMYTQPESGPSAFGRKSIPIFVETVTKQGAVFDVYRTKEGVRKREKEGVATVPLPSPPPKAEETKELIPIFQDILSRVEKWVDGVTQRGTFLRAFNRARMEKSGDYFFLDPFSGEFSYQDGTIRFAGETSGKDFARGILECLRSSLPHLEKEFPKNRMFPLKLRAEIESSLEYHKDAMKVLGIDANLSTFFQ
ncbi:MAG: DUF4388 domain-containing protein [Thermodesulfobacteriota bacterium]